MHISALEIGNGDSGKERKKHGGSLSSTSNRKFVFFVYIVSDEDIEARRELRRKREEVLQC